jgi:predicted GH43/DUF377 family glycosyl hydrolase
LERPDVCLLRGDPWVFGPEENYERFGDVNNVVFPCGLTVKPDEDTIVLYYGAADTCIAAATGSIQRLLSWLEEYGRVYAVREPAGITILEPSLPDE